MPPNGRRPAIRAWLACARLALPLTVCAHCVFGRGFEPSLSAARPAAMGLSTSASRIASWQAVELQALHYHAG